jgi:ribonuclease HI
MLVKSLKLGHQSALNILAGKSNSTWRLNDDKDLHVNDRVELVDKQDQSDSASWQPFGVATITCVLEKQLGAVSQTDMQAGEKLPALKDLLKEFRDYYGPQVSAETPVKIIRFTFHGLTPDAAPPEVSLTKMQLYADGGSRGNPGPSASGYLLLDQQGAIIAQKGLFLGVTTNNQAEYQALKLGLEEAIRRGVQQLDVYMDSMLVVNQMKGIYKVKNSDLRAIHQSITELASRFTRLTFNHVPRERNKQADALVNEILDAS